MTDMVQRVERAILNEIARQMREGPRVEYPAVARAAIDAMREPSEEMLTWGEAAAILSFDSSEPDSRNIRPIWRAMVDEALK